MKIRSITYFYDPLIESIDEALGKAGAFLAEARPAVEALGYEVQTARIATTPFPEYIQPLDALSLLTFAKELESKAAKAGFAYTSLGPALMSAPESYALIPQVLKDTEITFFCAEMATKENGADLAAVRACAKIIHELAPMDPNGFTNLYFTALANAPAGSPFFPASYHRGGPPAFAFATEAASLAVDAFSDAPSLDAGVEQLIKSIEDHGSKLDAVGEKLSETFGIDYLGIDLSLAPFPADHSSLGNAMEQVGVPRVGQHGSLAAAALLADAIDKASFRRTGFSGLLLPPLEDSTLAARGADGSLTVKDLLMYSAVCGTGLDTVPLPGDTKAEEMTPLLLDLAVLALRLDKPLTARLMPIPGKAAGERTTFDFAFFANSRILPLKAEPLIRHLADDAVVKVKRRG